MQYWCYTLVLYYCFRGGGGGLKKSQLKGACQCCTISNGLEANTILGQELTNMIVVLKKVLEA